ncbi:unnamed protein product [Clonostachys rosea]|uniref:Glycosyl transferase n=1 Tax=Bionectria ochroleuca TaxID=29856 RepID=A0ABY6UGC0_BIOOC|nr:unnamed protein product [Clonostachys rosea]
MHLPLGEPKAGSGIQIFSRRHRIIVCIAALFLLSTIIFYLPFERRSYLRHLLLPPTRYTKCKLEEPSALTCNATLAAKREPIPNIAHYVFILRDPSGDFSFQFSHFLSIYSAYHLWRPDKIYLHTNVAPDSDPVTRAKTGSTGKWNQLIFKIPNLIINTVTVPTHAGNGVEISGLEHKSDFVRVKAVHDFGGTYVDFDVFPLRDLKPLRERGFATIGGRQEGGELNSGTFMGVAGSRALTEWMEEMNRVYDGGWTTHSNAALTAVGNRLAMEQPCEMLALNQAAFAPGSWLGHDIDNLFHTHEGAPIIPPGGNSSMRQGLPLEEEDIPEDFDADKSLMPGWARDFSCTYLLHAFNGNKARHGVSHNNIDPRYALDLRSNFARAVYPVAKLLFDQKVISLDDSDLGK